MTAAPDPNPTAFPTAREWAEAVLEVRTRLMARRQRAFPAGALRKCPTCHKKSLEGRDDLLRETIVGSMAVVHHNLHGARCRSCGTELLEPYEELALEEAGPERRLTDYKARITSVSGKNLGTYWPKDIVRVMDLHSQDALHVQVLDADTMIIQRHHQHE